MSVRKYMQCYTLPVALPGLPMLPVNGITGLWFNDMEPMAKLFSSEGYMKQIRPGEEKFLHLHKCSFLIMAENSVV